MKVHGHTQKDLLALPVRDWDALSEYDALYVVPTKETHESGYRLMAIVGASNKEGPIEIAAFCDDLCWEAANIRAMSVRMDMIPTNNCVHIWGNGVRFRVGRGLSSTSLFVIDA